MTIRLTLILAVALTGAATVLTHHDKRPGRELLAASALPVQPLSRAALSRATRGERRLPLRVKPTPRLRSHPRVIRSGSHLHNGLNWRALSECEASGNPHAIDPSGTYFGLYQFDLQTWRSVGGTGNPADASPAEQTYRAQLLYAERGRAPWPICGRYL